MARTTRRPSKTAKTTKAKASKKGMRKGVRKYAKKTKALRRSKRTSLYQGVRQLTTFHSTSSHAYPHRSLGFQARVFQAATHGNWSSVATEILRSGVGRQECGDNVILDTDDIGLIRNLITTYMQSGFSNVQMNSLRFLLKSFRVRYELKNFSKDTAYVDIYDVLPRRDIGIDDNGPTNTPTIAFQQGVKDQVTVFDSTMYTRPGQVPFDSKQFNTTYKCHKVTRIILSPGGTHEHIVTGHPNYIFNWSQVIATSGTIKAWKGLSAFSLFVIRGSIGLGSDATATYENAEVAIVASKAVEYAFTNTAVNVTSNTYTLQNSLFNGINMVNPNTSALDTYSTVV